MRALLLLPIVVAGCVTEVHRHEDEPLDDRSNEAMQGLFDCSIRTDTGYRDGDPFPIDVVTIDERPVERRAANAYLALQAAAAQDGVRVRIVSGFRTMAQQQYLYGCYVDCDCNNCNLAAVPGTSNHQSGHAFDLNTSDAGVLAWLNAHAHRYGFERTVASEPWHWEHWGPAPDEPCGANGLVEDDALTDRERDALGGAHRHDPAGSSDVDGDGAPDLCARAGTGFSCFRGDGAGGFAGRIDGPDLVDENGWSRPSSYRALRTADVDGDGDADLCGRSARGWRCWPSRGDAFGPSTLHAILDDEGGWSAPSRHGTITMADVDGDGRADVCARGAARFKCWTDGFARPFPGPEWSDERGWDAPARFTSIRMGDVDGDGRDDVCGRGKDGVRCFLSDGRGLTRKVVGPAWADEDGWDAAEHGATIRLVDVDGDRRADLCGRGPKGFECRRSRGDAFGPALAGPPLNDAEGWGRRGQVATLDLVDVDGDGDRDLCGRDDDGVRCWRFDGEGFAGGFQSSRMADAAGWDDAARWRTIRFVDVDVDGDADLCGRGRDGWRCFPSTGDGFAAPAAGPAWADDGPFARAVFHWTVRLR